VISIKGSKILVKMLKVYGVEFIFGVPGDTGTALYEALFDEKESIKHVLARQERSAGFMADVYARLTGKTGICEAPSGGGATYILPAVAEANDSSIPLIAITTDVAENEKNKNTITDLDQYSIFKPITKWNTVISSANGIPAVIRKAFRLANSGRPGAINLSIPKNVLEEEVKEEEIASEIYREKTPDEKLKFENEIKEFIHLIKNAEFPVIVAGGGVLISGAENELLEFIEYSGIPVATTITGKGSVSEIHPLSLGVIGGNGGRDYANEIVKNSDLVIFIGCKTGSVATLNWSLVSKNARVIQIDIDPNVIGKNYKNTLGITTNAKSFLRELTVFYRNNFRKKEWINDPITKRILEYREQWLTSFDRKFRKKIHPFQIIKEMQKLLPDDSIIIVDPGTATPYIAGCYIQKKPGRKIIFPRAHGGLGYALPSAIAAKLAFPDLPVFSLIGDGSIGFCLGELETALRLNAPAVFIVFNNGCFSWIKTLQFLYHNEKYFSVDFHPLDYSKIASAFGIKSMKIKQPSEIETALIQVVNTNNPFLLDFTIDELPFDIPPVHFWKEINKMKNSE